ncbi:hypothetical protein FRC10_002288 [Ceratobasidium sp. 414]|nr:hypothetical protein FRC10_002288 [Ceratobasidium sp. 414]
MLTILSTASTYLRAFDTRLSGYSTGLNVVPPSSAGTVHSLQVMFNLLRGCQVAVDRNYNQDPSESEEPMEGKQEEELARGVLTFCRACQVLMASDPKDLEEGVLAEQFVAQGAHPETQSSLFEHACLSLALLLNLVKEGAGGLYQKLQEMGTLQSDFHSTFLLGYLAVLLGLLTVNDESIKDKVYDGLPGESGSNKFEDLAQSIEQFVHAYERVARATKLKGLAEREDGKESEETMATSGDTGSGVALDVARRLRDMF